MDNNREKKDNQKVSGHHHHNHRHHHHRRHREDFIKPQNNRGGIKRKWQKFYAKNETILKRLSIGLVFFIVLGVAMLVDNVAYKPDEKARTSSSVYIEVSSHQNEVTLVNTAFLEYLSSDMVSAHDVWGKYKGFVQRLDVGLPFTLAYKANGITNNKTVSKTKIEISENENFTDSRVVFSNNTEDSVDIYHLKTNTQYYYRVSMEVSDGTIAERDGRFKTADTPRILSIGGLVNVRDIGNWKTTDKKRIKQGLLYRGSEPDGAVVPDYCLTEKGAEEMIITLGIKTDMDLRAPEDMSNSVDFYWDNVEHNYYNAPMYTDVFLQSNKETMRKIFSDLSCSEKYPVYMHCTYGRDRTGVVCFLLEALLGVEEDDIIRDYELTTMYDGYFEAEKFSEFVKQFKNLPGGTFKDKAENYLISVGVSEDEIANIRKIFLD